MINHRCHLLWRKVLLSVGLGVLLLEGAGHVLLGNYAQSELVQRMEDPNLCLALGKNRDLTYTGWYRKVQPTLMESNEFTSREPRKNLKEQGDNLSLFILGDSFTYGQGVNYDEALPYQVQSLINPYLTHLSKKKVDVWNFGVPGRHFYQIPSDIERLLTLNPDAIVVNLFINDFHEAPGQCFFQQDDWRLKVMRECYVCRGVLMAFRPQPVLLSKEEIAVEVANTIQQIQAIGVSENIPIWFVLMMDGYAADSFEYPLPDIADILRRNTENWIDLRMIWEQILRNPQEMEIAGEYHLTPLGNQVLAQEYAKQLGIRLNREY